VHNPENFDHRGVAAASSIGLACAGIASPLIEGPPRSSASVPGMLETLQEGVNGSLIRGQPDGSDID
jgi:hypothetical protein